MTAHNNLGKYSQKGKMGTSVALQRMVRTTNTHRTYSSLRVLTSCYEKLMVRLKKKAALKFFNSTMNPGLAKTLLMCVCSYFCLYLWCLFSHKHSTNHKDLFLVLLMFLSMVCGSLASHQFTKQDCLRFSLVLNGAQKWVSYVKSLSYVPWLDNIKRRTESHCSSTLL